MAPMTSDTPATATATAATPEPRRFSVARADDGHPIVHLDGVKISQHLIGYELREQRGDLPVVVLHLSKRATMDATFEGLATVVVGVEPDPGPAAAAFLGAIDPAQLETAALNSPDLDTTEPNGLTRAMLAQLGRWAQGRD